jgi:hypothetical protein
MWRALIEHADVVVAVRKPDGSLGEATAGEVAYADLCGTPVHHFVLDTPAPRPEDYGSLDVPVLLRAAAEHAPAVVSPSGVAASTVRALGGHAADVETGAEADPHLVGMAVQILNAALGRGWTTRQISEGARS